MIPPFDGGLSLCLAHKGLDLRACNAHTVSRIAKHGDGVHLTARFSRSFVVFFSRA